MAETKIEWTRGPNGEQGFSFNPWVGCTKISPACDHCYAESWAKRSGMVQWGPGAARRRTSEANWRQPLKWDREAEKNGTSPRVFCASLADVFDNDVPQEWRRDLFDLILSTPHLTWMLLTKRIGNVQAMLEAIIPQAIWNFPAHHPLSWPWPHVWLGATICNQDEADRDLQKLLAVPAAVHFVSIEPMLGQIDLTRVCVDNHATLGTYLNALRGHRWDESAYSGGGPPIESDPPDTARIDWVISGGESGPAARPAHPDWFRSLRDQCAAAGVPYLHKQNGEWVSVSDVSGPGRHYTFPDGATVRRVGKKLAGRAIDGITHDRFPSALA